MLTILARSCYIPIMSKRIKVYEYSNCSTCKKALKYLDTNEIEYEAISIVEHPPTLTELKQMLEHYKGQVSKLFNTSGVMYRELELSKRLPTMSKDEAIQLLSKNGKLIKRPFLLTEKRGVVGFKQEEWETVIRP